MQYDFDSLHNRRGTDSIKWDYLPKDGIFQTREAGLDPLANGELLPMGLADMDFPTCKPVIDALVQRAQHGIFGYTKSSAGYFEAIIKWIWKRQLWRVEQDWILTTSGVLPAINLAIQTFTEPGDGIIIQPPVFPPFGQAIENNGRAVVRNSLRRQGDRYLVSFEDLESKAADPNTKMILFCSPHNPVGRVWSHKELYRLGSICERHNLLIVSDEIHGDLIYSWATFLSFGAMDERFHDRLILCSGPSKAFNLPGLKISNTIIPNKMLRERYLIALRNLNELFSVGTFGTLALQTAYEQGAEWLAQSMAYIENNYSYLHQFVAQYLPCLKVIRPEALYLIWIDCRGLGLDAKALEQLFVEKARVYLDQGHEYGTEGDGFVRINIACPRIVLETSLKRIRLAIDGLAAEDQG